MGRARKRENQGLPQNLLCRKRKRANGKIVEYYFYVLSDGKEKSLGTDKHQAILETAKLNLDRSLPPNIINFIVISERYEREVIPTKSKNTQNTNKTSLKWLKKFFTDCPTLESIEPRHIKMYLTWRKNSPNSANNEIALFHHIWNCAREWGYTKLACPSEGIARHKMVKREVYIEDHIYQKVYKICDQDMKDLMDIAYLTGQRPIDIVNIHHNHIYDNILHITQQKTKAKLRFAIKGKLKEILDRRLQLSTTYLFKNKTGTKLSRHSLTVRFQNIRILAIKTYPELEKELSQFQFRDLRAKAGTDTSLSKGDEAARKQLGHTSVQMTKRYIRKDGVIDPTE